MCLALDCSRLFVGAADTVGDAGLFESIARARTFIIQLGANELCFVAAQDWTNATRLLRLHT